MLDALDVASMLRGFAIADALLFVLALPIWLFLRWLMRRYFGDLLPASRSPEARKFLIGLGVGCLSLVIVVAPAFLAGSFVPGPGAEGFDYEIDGWPGAMVVAVFVLLFQSLAEELAFRAVAMGFMAAAFFAASAWVLDRRERRRGDPNPLRHSRRLGWLWLGSGAGANVVLSVLFAVVHMDNPNATGLAALNIGLISLALGLMFWVQGSVLGAWAFHWAWNAGLAIVGLPVSGLALLPPAHGFGFVAARADVLSGGDFGPEASLACTVLATVLVVVLSIRSISGMRSATRLCSGRVSWVNTLR